MQTEWREKLVNRFLKYVSVYTESEAFVDKFPSTDRQWDLAKYLVEELKSIGLEDVSIVFMSHQNFHAFKKFATL